MFRSVTIFWISLLLFTLPVMGQRYEIGTWIGVSNYFGDINTNTSFEFVRPAGGFISRQIIDPHWSTKLTISAGRILGKDNVSSYPFQQVRNLDFNSNLVDVSGTVEFNFFKYITGDKKFKFTPYLLSGLSIFYFSPRSNESGGVNPHLDLYGTEGQGFKRKKYFLVQMAVPYGIGLKYNIGGFWNWGIEVVNHKAFTDYIDDISTTYVDPRLLENHNGEIAVELADKSNPAKPLGIEGKQRGNSRDNDSYLFIGTSITYTIRSVRCPLPY